MMAAQEKAAGVGTPEAACKETDAPSIDGSRDDGKRVDTLIARFALMGHAVHRLADGGFLAERWGLTRHCADVTALQAFLVQIGGQP